MIFIKIISEKNTLIASYFLLIQIHFFYHIKTDKDVYEEFWGDRSLFDNSDYPKSSKFFSGENKKVIGKFKDEAAGKPILEFVG